MTQGRAIVRLTLVDRPPFGPAIGPGSYQNRDQCLHRPGTGPGLAVQGQWPRFMWGNGPGWWQQPGPMLRRPTRGALRGIGPGCWPQPGLLPCLYKPPSQHFATLPQKIQHCVGVGWVLEFFSFDCTPGVRRNVQATLRSSEHRILGRG